ncbi:hypothetical protein [Desulfocastanea catecholica]
MANKWQAARHGLSGTSVDPTDMPAACRISYHEVAQTLMRFIEPMFVRLGSEQYVGFVERIRSHGTGADLLRRRYEETGNLQDVVQSLQGEFWQ